MSTGANPSDSIDVLEAQDSAERLTQRVLVLVTSDRPPNPWNPARPRALTEPRLEAWAAAHLGDPASIVLIDGQNGPVTLERAGLSALDLVYTAGSAGLERALRSAVPDLGATPLTTARDPAWPARLRAFGQLGILASALRATIAGAHPLLPSDLAPPGAPAGPQLAAALPELVARVSALVGSLSGTVATLAGTVGSIPADGILTEAADRDSIVRAIEALDAFGLALEPDPSLPLDLSWARAAWQTAEARGLAAQALVEQIREPPAGSPASATLDLAQEVARTVFGSGFLVVPLLPNRPRLKKEGLLTRDARAKERKKYGMAGARKRFQFSKR
jgi:hypothetical protein